MISREDFIFTIGYEGGTAIVDGKARKRFGRMATKELGEAGLYRPAFASALFSKDEDEMRGFMAFFNAKAGTDISRIEDFQRFFGVSLDHAQRILVL